MKNIINWACTSIAKLPIQTDEDEAADQRVWEAKIAVFASLCILLDHKEQVHQARGGAWAGYLYAENCPYYQKYEKANFKYTGICLFAELTLNVIYPEMRHLFGVRKQEPIIEVYQVIEHFCQTSPEYSGVEEYPVKPKNGRDWEPRQVREAFHDTQTQDGNLWGPHDYGKARWAMAEHVHKCLADDLVGELRHASFNV